MRMTESEYSDLMNRKQSPLKLPQTKTPLEDQEQAALVVWLRQRGIRHHATPNGGFRHIATAGKLKAQGVMPGIPDLTIWPDPGSGLPVLWIEMKRTKGGTLSEDQRLWIDYIRMLKGHDAAVCRGFEEARDYILGWGY